MQPSLARCMVRDSESELAVAKGQVVPESKVFRLRTELFVKSSLTVTARYIYSCIVFNIITFFMRTFSCMVYCVHISRK